MANVHAEYCDQNQNHYVKTSDIHTILIHIYEHERLPHLHIVILTNQRAVTVINQPEPAKEIVSGVSYICTMMNSCTEALIHEK